MAFKYLSSIKQPTPGVKIVEFQISGSRQEQGGEQEVLNGLKQEIDRLKKLASGQPSPGEMTHQ